MNKLLLKKLEERTLYLFELQEDNVRLGDRVELLEKLQQGGVVGRVIRSILKPL